MKNQQSYISVGLWALGIVFLAYFLAILLAFTNEKPSMFSDRLFGDIGPRPSVLRIEAKERSGSSLGTGTCVASIGNQSLVITAWHVVRDSKGPYTVNGLDARLVQVDKVWDLAALVVSQKLPVSVLGDRKPVIGDNLTVCGYGSGEYKESTGKVTGFFSPAGLSETDWVRISVPARSGDSGGPMFYDDGSIAAVLFGSDAGAHGTQCLRVRSWVASLDIPTELKNEALSLYRIY